MPSGIIMIFYRFIIPFHILMIFALKILFIKFSLMIGLPSGMSRVRLNFPFLMDFSIIKIRMPLIWLSHGKTRAQKSQSQNPRKEKFGEMT